MEDKRNEIIPETFIVTVSDTMENFKVDMALPADFLIGKMRHKLLDVLKAMDEERFSRWQECLIRYNNRLLLDRDTLLRAGVFEGCRLIVSEGSKGTHPCKG